MSDLRKTLSVWSAILAVGIILGLGVGWKLWSPESQKTPVVEAHAPAEHQADGSQILERNPDADAKPAQQIPKGAKVERVVQVIVQPSQPVAPLPHSGSAASVPNEPARTPCPPVRVDLTLVRMADQSQRVIASSPDGQVVGGVDIPVEATLPPPKILKWAAGAVYGTTAWGDTAKGAFVDRDFAFLRTGLELTKNSYSMANRQGWEMRAKVGLRF